MRRDLAGGVVYTNSPMQLQRFRLAEGEHIALLLRGGASGIICSRSRIWTLLGRQFLVAFTALLAALPVRSAPPPSVRGDLGIHDPSTVIKCKDKYYIFGTGDNISSKSSPDKVLWTAGPTVFSSPPSWTSNAVPGFAKTFWAPDIFYLNGKYCLYYAISTWGSQVSAIGLVTNPTLDPTDPAYLWTDQGPVIQSDGSSPYNTIDPSVTFDAGGNPWMSFGSYWTGIYVVQLDPLTGLRIAANSPTYRVAYNGSIEASALLRRGGYYYLFVNWGSCCAGVNSTYNIRVGRSTSITGPYLDRNGVDMVNNGGTLFLEGTGKYTGPGHMGFLSEGTNQWFTYHYYDANTYASWYNAFGPAKFDLRPLSWTTDGWPAFTNDWSAEYEFVADAYDENGQYYGMLLNGASIQSDPVQGRVLTLSGTNQYVALPPGVAFAHTFSAVIKWNGGSDWQRVFDFGTDTSRYVMLTTSDGNHKLACHIRANGVTKTLAGPSGVPVGVWTHVAVTLDGSRGVLYMNGTPVATNSSMTLSPVNVLAQTNYLGHSKFVADLDFNGQIANFRVYGRALSAAEIASLQPSVNSTTNWWGSFYPFLNGAADSSNRYNGTLMYGASIQTDATRGRVLQLSGSSQYVSLPSGAGAAQTFAGWVKWNGGASWQRIFDFGVDTRQWFMLTPRNADGEMEVAISTDRPSYVQVIQSPVSLETGVWTHVAVVLDGRQGILYTNGYPAAINYSVNLLPSDIPATRNYFGRSQFSGDAYFNGRLDSIRLDSRGLSPAELFAPAPVIAQPALGTLYSGGQAVSYRGSATDYSDASLGSGAFVWSGQFFHDGQSNSVFGPVSGSTNGSFQVAATGPTTTNAFYRLKLQVTDDRGLQRSVSTDLLPRIIQLGLETVPTGLQVNLDGQPLTAPASVSAVAGLVRTLAAPSPQTFAGSNYNFVLWSDGGAPTHTITAPLSDATYTASFVLPSLGMAGSGTNLVLTWPSWAGSLNLWSATNLTPPVDWTLVPNTPVVSNGLNTILISRTNDGSYYRLSSP